EAVGAGSRGAGQETQRRIHPDRAETQGGKIARPAPRRGRIVRPAHGRSRSAREEAREAQRPDGRTGGSCDPVRLARRAQRADRSTQRLKIFPGFMMFFGSRARLIDRITSIVPAPVSVTRKSILCSPTPCSPVQVPPRSSARITRL